MVDETLFSDKKTQNVLSSRAKDLMNTAILNHNNTQRYLVNVSSLNYTFGDSLDKPLSKRTFGTIFDNELNELIQVKVITSYTKTPLHSNNPKERVYAIELF